MAYVNSRVTLNRGRLRALSAAAVRSLEMTAEAVHTDVVQAQVIPRLGGNLQNTTHCDFSQAGNGNGVATIVSEMVYARRLYYHPEYNFTTTENPNARGRWYEDWLTGGKRNFARNAFKQFYRRNGGL